MIISTPPETADAAAVDDLVPELELRSLNFSLVAPNSRLDQALVALVPEFSRSYLAQLIDLGAVMVNGRQATKAAYRVKVTDQGVIELRPTPQSQAFRPETIPLDIVYSDAHLLVVNKAAGMVVHPAPGNWSGTLMNAILGMDGQASQLPRAGIVHRLDKDTSGLMVVARSRLAMDALVKAIAARQVKRQYLALCHIPWEGALRREIIASVGRDPSNRLRMAVVDVTRHPGKQAQTDVRLLANGGDGCLLQCTLQTGRTHQIRVHMASIGHPLVADATYGGHQTAGMQRQALHAYRLAFDHPIEARPLAFHSPLPDDFSHALSDWGIPYNEVETSL